MPKELNIINRIGSKTNDIKHFKHLLPLNVSTIVEPFGGSFAVIKHFYKDCNKYKFHINDNDEHLYYRYKNYKDLIDLCLKIQDHYKATYGVDKLENEKDKGYLIFKNWVVNYNAHESLKDFILREQFIRGSCYKAVKSKLYSKTEANILDNALITNYDYKDILETYKDNEDAFIPYIFQNNTPYQKQNGIDTDSTDIISYILDYFKVCKCKVMLIINSLKLLKWLFKDYIKGEYTRIYQLSNKKDQHLIVCNY